MNFNDDESPQEDNMSNVVLVSSSSSEGDPSNSTALLIPPTSDSSKTSRKRRPSGKSKSSLQESTEDAMKNDSVLSPVSVIPEETRLAQIESSSESSDTSRDDIPLVRKYVGVAVLFFINLLNYMDRFTIAGVLTQITEYFEISNSQAGLLQTVFIISYMLAAPVFGYLGDRYNRKVIMTVGLVLWSGITFVSSFINNPNMFYAFLALRALVGIGEASYSTISPTMIGDMFANEQRTRMLTVFYFAIPLGSGLGYIVGSKAAALGGSWQWALRVTPVLGVVSIILMVVLCPNPQRGASETRNATSLQEKTKYVQDLKYLTKNKSFILVTLGFTAMAFVIGSLTLWGPVYFRNALVVTGQIAPCTDEKCDGDVSFIFGVITCLAGVVGVWIGSIWATKWKARGTKNADALVCAIANFVPVPLLLFICNFAVASVNVSWVMLFIADLFLCMTWTLVGDMSLYVVMPVRRSTAQAVLILTGHLFGDAGSPFLIGMIYDKIEESLPNTYYNRYISLAYAMYVTLFVCVVGGGCFLMASLYVVDDKKKVDDEIKRLNSSPTASNNSTSSSSSMEMNHANKIDVLQHSPSKLAKPDIIPNTPPNNEVPQTSINYQNEDKRKNKDLMNIAYKSSSSSSDNDDAPLLGKETII